MVVDYLENKARYLTLLEAKIKAVGIRFYGWYAYKSIFMESSLETISFMPLSSADPFGGLIITDWYTLK